MARIRSIKPEFWASESLGRLAGPEGRQARLLFIALWNHAEDHGVCRAAPALIRSQAFPYDEDVSASDVSRWLALLECGRFIVRYERNGSAYAWIRGFDEHQKIDRKSKTTLPEPSRHETEACTSPRNTSDRPTSEPVGPCTSPRRALDEPSLQEGKGGEGNGEEEDSASQATASAAPLVGDELPDATAKAEEVADRTALVLVAQEWPQKPASATEAKPRPPQPGLVLYERLEAARASLCEEHGVPFVPSRWAYSRQNRGLGPIARLPEGHEEQVRFAAAWDAFAEDPVALTREPPFSLDWFWKCRSRYEGRAVQAGGGT